MSSRLGHALLRGIFLVILAAGIVAPATPAFADSPAVSGTRTTQPDSTSDKCTKIQNGVKTCAISKLGNGLVFFALAACVAGLLYSCILWVLGGSTENEEQRSTGTHGIVISLAAAFLIAAYPALTTYYDKLANKSNVDKTGVTHASPFTDKNTNGSGG